MNFLFESRDNIFWLFVFFVIICRILLVLCVDRIFRGWIIFLVFFCGWKRFLFGYVLFCFFCIIFNVVFFYKRGLLRKMYMYGVLGVCVERRFGFWLILKIFYLILKGFNMLKNRRLWVCFKLYLYIFIF